MHLGTDFNIWWHCDYLRPTLVGFNSLVIDVGGWPKLGISPGHGSLAECQLVEEKLRALCENATFEVRT